MYRQIVLAIVEFIEKNELLINNIRVEVCSSRQYDDTWHGIKFAYDTTYVDSLEVYIAPALTEDINKQINEFAFLEIDPSYKDNHEDESVIYTNLSFPTSLEQVPDFCKLLISEYVPNILANKDIYSLSLLPATIHY